MHRLNRPRALPRVLLALLATLTLLPLALVLDSSPVQAVQLSRSTGYTCQYSGVETEVAPPTDGLPVVGGLPVPVLPSTGGSDPVTVAVRVDAPASIAPGGTLRLKGTAAFTFGPDATATNASTVFSLLSDSFGLNVSADGIKRFVRITKLTTTRSTAGSPTVTASFSLPDYLVPSTATGRLTLSLPDEAVVTNPVSNNPASVAFTGLLRTDSRTQPNRAVGCALGAGQSTTIGSVTVTAPASEPTGAPSASPSAAPSAPSGAPSEGGQPPAVPPVDTGSGTGSTEAPGLPVDPVSPPASQAPATPLPSATLPVVPSTEVANTTLLAAEPIPPATVASGLRLPPWGALLVGAFLAGGVFLAVSSHRRLRQLTAAAAVLALLTVVPSPLNPQAPAEAATGQAQVTLICVYQADGSAEDARARNQPTGLSISLDVPDSVAPGEVLTLTGTATVQAPEDIRSQASQLGYNQLDAISDYFSVGLTVGGGKRQIFPADRWQTGKTAFSNPLVVRGPLYFPGFKVPDDASGSIRLELPRNEVVDRRPKPYSNDNTPPKVAVEFLASATGNGTSANYIVSCWRSDNGDGLIATIPVAKPSAAQPGQQPTQGGGTGSVPPTAAPGTQPTSGGDNGGVNGTGNGTGQQPAGGQPTAPTSQAPGTVPGQVPSQAPGQVATAVPGQVATGVVPGTTVTTTPTLQGAQPTAASATSGEIVVPTGLTVIALLLAAVAYGFAGWNQLRLRSARKRDLQP